MKILSETRLVLTPAQINNRAQRPYPNRPRSPGKHVQAINRALGVAAGKMDSDESLDYPFERFSDALYPLLPALGVAWEEFRVSLYPEDHLLWQPCELERDGIYGTPDGLLIVNVETAWWECKATTKKIKPVSDLWMYLRQGMSYCAMSGVRRVLYDILFLLGDYSRPFQPIGTSTLVEFTDQEVESWWRIVLGAADGVKAEGVVA